jgi:VWFA-related protein
VFRLIVLAICVLTTVSLSGQTGPTFRAGANYVRVDMYATKDGVSIDDLTPEEVEVLEDGVVQKIEAFEHVKVAPAGPQELRAEPNSVAESREMAGDPRARVFVIFLDTYHTRIEGSANMRLPLVRFLDRVLGQDDMVAIMTPEMAASDIALGRKTTVISNIMQTQWTWGRRNRTVTDNDPKENLYDGCYGGPVASPSSSNAPLSAQVEQSLNTQSIAAKMKARRREKMTLDALEDLIVHLNGIREERKAVLTVTEGWLLFTPDSELARSDERFGVGVRPGDVLGRPPVPRPSDTNQASGSTRIECETDKMALALMDHSNRLREITETANRSNVTFYPVFARGLVPFDSDIGPDRPPTLQQDGANLSARHDSLRFLADMTDGTSVINTNNIEGALKRITDDLSSYYLFGYYSTNSKLDGRFRDITVRVKRPGAKVRARRGYRGRTAEDVLSGGSAESRGDAAVTNAMSAVAGINNRAQFRIRSAAWSRPGSDSTVPDAVAPGGAFWLVGELDYRLRKELAWTAGAVAELTVAAADGTQVMTREIKVAANQGTFVLEVPESGRLQPGEYAVRVRLRPEANGELALNDLARVIVGAPKSIGEAVLWRRGPTTGPQYLRTADPRFSRSDRIRLELATAAPGPSTARLLDRVGKPIQVPLQVTARQDSSGGFSWVVVDGTLSPLAAGDYAIEVTQGDAKQVTAFRIVP